jgi:hypothetical protein
MAAGGPWANAIGKKTQPEDGDLEVAEDAVAIQGTDPPVAR